MPLLQVQNLHTSYGKLKVLFGVDLEVKKGKIVVIIGPNGSGKSTVLKCIVGLLEKEKGRVVFKGQNLAFVPQGRKVFDSMTVEENLEVGGYKLKKSKIPQQLSKIYHLFPILRKKKDQRANLLSGGQQQMLSIGRGLITKPDLLVLDEPSLGLDSRMQAMIFKKIKQINQQGTAVLLVEQNVKQATKLADRVYALENGRNVEYNKNNDKNQR